MLAGINGKAIFIGIAGLVAALSLTAVTLTGDVTIRAGGVAIALGGETAQRGNLVRLETVRCVSSCPAFAMEWKLP